MYTSNTQYNKWIYRSTMLALTISLLGSCSQAHHLGMEDNSQEILEMKLNNPETILTSNQSISLVNHCARLGEQNAEKAQEKVTCLVVGNTGVGKSTFLNGVMGCKLKLVKLRELGLKGVKKVIIVDPDSTKAEVMPIGHGRQSKTFLPRIAPDPSLINSAYCDCPGFADNRGEEINIANAINIKSVLQKARGIKAILLAKYHDLIDRGPAIQSMENICLQMFGSVDNLRKYQNTVLLGVTKAPLHEDDEPLHDMVRESLIEANTPIAQILANRIFLFDPLDRAVDNPDFWSLERCRTEIAQLEAIPKHEATTLFQTVLTGDDQTKLKLIMRDQATQLAQALEQDDYETAEHHWQSLVQLKVIGSDEVEKMTRELAGLPLRHFVLRRISAYNKEALQYNFEEAERQLALLRRLFTHFNNEVAEHSIESAEATLRNSKEKKRREDAGIRDKIEKAKLEEIRKEREKADQRVKEEAIRLRKELFEDNGGDGGCCTIS